MSSSFSSVETRFIFNGSQLKCHGFKLSSLIWQLYLLVDMCQEIYNEIFSCMICVGLFSHNNHKWKLFVLNCISQHLEHTSIANILRKHQIIDYYRYVDDIVIVYDEQEASINNMLKIFNAIHPKFKFTIEQQTQNKINYLDLTIIKNQNKLNFEIYRKPTTTDFILHNTSCHPCEYKKISH
jgi:long-subunit acyl-CoA synthetase (AMP-forming)